MACLFAQNRMRLLLRLPRFAKAGPAEARAMPSRFCARQAASLRERAASRFCARPAAQNLRDSAGLAQNREGMARASGHGGAQQKRALPSRSEASQQQKRIMATVAQWQSIGLWLQRLQVRILSFAQSVIKMQGIQTSSTLLKHCR